MLSETVQVELNRTEEVALDELNELETLVKQSINLDFLERSIDDWKENSQENKMFVQMGNSSI